MRQWPRLHRAVIATLLALFLLARWTYAALDTDAWASTSADFALDASVYDSAGIGRNLLQAQHVTLTPYNAINNICMGDNENDYTFELNCTSTGGVVVIREVFFGREANSTACPDPVPANNLAACPSPAASTFLYTACDGLPSCRLSASPGVFGGDPCPGVRKYLRVRFSCSQTGDDALWAFLSARPTNQTIGNLGVPDMTSGWYDAQCQGRPDDYCRYIMDSRNRPYWSCALSGSNINATARGQFLVDSTSADACSVFRAALPRVPAELVQDEGTSGGMYDAQCQGAANDYCRFPALWLWSCIPAGSSDTLGSTTITEYLAGTVRTTPCYNSASLSSVVLGSPPESWAVRRGLLAVNPSTGLNDGEFQICVSHDGSLVWCNPPTYSANVLFVLQKGPCDAGGTCYYLIKGEGPNGLCIDSATQPVAARACTAVDSQLFTIVLSGQPTTAALSPKSARDQCLSRSASSIILAYCQSDRRDGISQQFTITRGCLDASLPTDYTFTPNIDVEGHSISCRRTAGKTRLQLAEECGRNPSCIGFSVYMWNNVAMWCTKYAAPHTARVDRSTTTMREPCLGLFLATASKGSSPGWRDGQRITFKSVGTNKYCSDDGILKCNRDAVGAWEIFTVAVTPPDGSPSLMSGDVGLISGRTDKYCSNNDRAGFVCNIDWLQSWETFSLIPIANAGPGRYALRSRRTNKFCSSASPFTTATCNSNLVGPLETFVVEEVAANGGCPLAPDGFIFQQGRNILGSNIKDCQILSLSDSLSEAVRAARMGDIVKECNNLNCKSISMYTAPALPIPVNMEWYCFKNVAGPTQARSDIMPGRCHGLLIKKPDIRPSPNCTQPPPPGFGYSPTLGIASQTGALKCAPQAGNLVPAFAMECAQTRNCAAFTLFYADYIPTYCLLSKTGPDAIVDTRSFPLSAGMSYDAAPGCVGTYFRTEQACDVPRYFSFQSACTYQPNNISCSVMNITVSQVADACLTTPGCVGFLTYRTSSDGILRYCLKSQIAASIICTEKGQYSRPCLGLYTLQPALMSTQTTPPELQFVAYTDRPGNNIASSPNCQAVGNKMLKDITTECMSQIGCVGFTYYGEGTSQNSLVPTYCLKNNNSATNVVDTRNMVGWSPLQGYGTYLLRPDAFCLEPVSAWSDYNSAQGIVLRQDFPCQARNGKTVAQIAQECRATANCVGFQLTVNRTYSEYCFTPSRQPRDWRATSPASDPCEGLYMLPQNVCRQAIPSAYVFKRNTDIPASTYDLECNLLSTKTVLDVSTECSALSGCVAFSIFNSTSTNDPTYCLKSAAPSSAFNQTTWITACHGLYVHRGSFSCPEPVPSRFTFIGLTDLTGDNDISCGMPRGTKTAMQLAQECLNTVGCVAFTTYMESDRTLRYCLKAATVSSSFSSMTGNRARAPQETKCLGTYVIRRDAGVCDEPPPAPFNLVAYTSTDSRVIYDLKCALRSSKTLRDIANECVAYSGSFRCQGFTHFKNTTSGADMYCLKSSVTTLVNTTDASVPGPCYGTYVRNGEARPRAPAVGVAALEDDDFTTGVRAVGLYPGLWFRLTCSLNGRSFVSGFRFTYQNQKGFGEDNTALNRIQLVCVDLQQAILTAPNVQSATFSQSITDGLPDNWANSAEASTAGPTCAPDYVDYPATGSGQQYFAPSIVKSVSQRVSPRTPGDSAGLQAIRMTCQTGQQLQAPYEGFDGSWYAEQECPDSQGLVGLEIKVQPPQGPKDDAAAVGVRPVCAPIPRTFESKLQLTNPTWLLEEYRISMKRQALPIVSTAVPPSPPSPPPPSVLPKQSSARTVLVDGSDVLDNVGRLFTIKCPRLEGVQSFVESFMAENYMVDSYGLPNTDPNITEPDNHGMGRVSLTCKTQTVRQLQQNYTKSAVGWGDGLYLMQSSSCSGIASALQQKVAAGPNGKYQDNTGLNAIRMRCTDETEIGMDSASALYAAKRPTNSQQDNLLKTLGVANTTLWPAQNKVEGLAGVWKAWAECPPKHAICGLTMRLQQTSANVDNVGAANVHSIRCCKATDYLGPDNMCAQQYAEYSQQTILKICSDLPAETVPNPDKCPFVLVMRGGCNAGRLVYAHSLDNAAYVEKMEAWSGALEDGSTGIVSLRLTFSDRMEYTVGDVITPEERGSDSKMVFRDYAGNPPKIMPVTRIRMWRREFLADGLGQAYARLKNIDINMDTESGNFGSIYVDAAGKSDFVSEISGNSVGDGKIMGVAALVDSVGIYSIGFIFMSKPVKSIGAYSYPDILMQLMKQNANIQPKVLQSSAYSNKGQQDAEIECSLSRTITTTSSLTASSSTTTEFEAGISVSLDFTVAISIPIPFLGYIKATSFSAGVNLGLSATSSGTQSSSRGTTNTEEMTITYGPVAATVPPDGAGKCELLYYETIMDVEYVFTMTVETENGGVYRVQSPGTWNQKFVSTSTGRFTVIKAAKCTNRASDNLCKRYADQGKCDSDSDKMVGAPGAPGLCVRTCQRCDILNDCQGQVQEVC